LQIIDFYRILIDSMKIKQTIMALSLLIGLGLIFVSPTVSAINCGDIPGGTSILECTKPAGCVGVECSGIWGILLLVINILSVGVGVTAVGGILYGSVMYTTAGGSVDQVKKARTIILNTIIGLAAFALMFSLLNYLIPGGLFS